MDKLSESHSLLGPPSQNVRSCSFTVASKLATTTFQRRNIRRQSTEHVRISSPTNRRWTVNKTKNEAKRVDAASYRATGNRAICVRNRSSPTPTFRYSKSSETTQTTGSPLNPPSRPLYFAEQIIATMTPKRPRALAKISTIRILTKSDGFCASLNAQLLPTTPTAMPQTRFEKPTIQPEKKRAYPVNSGNGVPDPSSGTSYHRDEMRIAMMTP